MEHLLKQQWDISLNCVSLAKIRELDNNKFSFAVQSLSHVQLFVTPWTVARQASLSFTNSWSLLKLNIHRVSDAIQPSHPLSSPSPSDFNLSLHQGLF